MSALQIYAAVITVVAVFASHEAFIANRLIKRLILTSPAQMKILLAKVVAQINGKKEN